LPVPRSDLSTKKIRKKGTGIKKTLKLRDKVMVRQQLQQNISHAFKINFIPGLILQAFAISIALCYFFWPASHDVFNYIALLKAENGWIYALISTAIFGGALPFIFLKLSNKIEVNTWKIFIFYMVFWAIKGVEVNIFYSFQAAWFGNGQDFATIATKVSVDQFIYSALWAAPSITIAYLWMDEGFNFTRWKACINKQLFQVKIPTVVVSNWLTWIPAVSVIYMMPPALQLPLFNLVLCFFVILISVLTKKKTKIIDI
jgi:hypothetical protein